MAAEILGPRNDSPNDELCYIQGMFALFPVKTFTDSESATASEQGFEKAAKSHSDSDRGPVVLEIQLDRSQLVQLSA